MDNRTIEEVRKNETKLIEEIKSLEKQLNYLRSGEYYNQLRFENEMLQQVVDTNGVPSEVYDYIDCTHRNTELLKENQQLKIEKEQLNSLVNSCQEEIRRLKLQLQQRDEVINKVKKYNEQIIKDTKDFYRPTSDRIYSGDCLIDIATQIIKTLDNKGEE